MPAHGIEPWILSFPPYLIGTSDTVSVRIKGTNFDSIHITALPLSHAGNCKLWARYLLFI